MALMTIPLGRVVVGERLRQTNKAEVDRLAESIREVGLLNPITVGEETEGGFPLVAGLHRLEACRALGMTEIGANVVSLTDLKRQLAECDENLAHSVLTTPQRAIFTAKRKEIYLALHPETAQRVAGGHGKAASAKNALAGSESENSGLGVSVVSEVPSFSEETARRTGRSRRIVDLDAQRGTSIPHDVLESVSGTDFGRGKSLNAIMRMMPEQQQELCEHIRAGRLVEAGILVGNAQHLKVVQLPGNCTKEVRNQMRRMENAWAVASDEARRRQFAKQEKRGDMRKYGPGAKPRDADQGEGA
jgi:ParB family chromosome partitioning protein